MSLSHLHAGALDACSNSLSRCFDYSYETSYSKLLEKMLKKDLALKGLIDGVELLIFPSTKLPVHSQRELMPILFFRSAVIMHAWCLFILKVASECEHKFVDIPACNVCIC